ncbi:MAG: hypothetical protein HY800_08300 [Ignavibacteriales bacterium]|nr:hypothetical protein [Ignavibacteriales bacterium]
MFRYILFLLLLYFAWRIIKTIFNIKSRGRRYEDNIPHIDKIQEAEFEDITNQPDSEQNQPTDKTKETPPSDSTS